VGEAAAGLIAAPGAARALAPALRRVAREPAAARARADAGRARVRARFSMDAMAGATHALYRRLAGTEDGTIEQAS
jgi:hypothetical protein